MKLWLNKCLNAIKIYLFYRKSFCCLIGNKKWNAQNTKFSQSIGTCTNITRLSNSFLRLWCIVKIPSHKPLLWTFQICFYFPSVNENLLMLKSIKGISTNRNKSRILHISLFTYLDVFHKCIWFQRYFLYCEICKHEFIVTQC